MTEFKKLTRNLSEIMRQKGWTDAKLAKELRVAVSTVYNWRVGQFEPRGAVLIRLCEVLGCSTNELCGIETKGPVSLNESLSKRDELGRRERTMSLEHKIILLREMKGLSQVQMAQLLDCSQAAISQYESGKREPSLSQLKQIVSVFGVKYDWLLEDTSNNDE